jgi:hypothetical protein
MRSRSGWTAAGAMCWHEGTIVVALGWLSLSTQS